MRISDAASHELLQLLSLYTNNIKVGDKITARVIAIESGILLLQLSDGSEISASSQTDAKYNPGDILKLEVAGIKQGQVYVTKLEHSQTAPSAAYTRDPVQILKNMKIPVNNDRLEVVKAILDMGFEPEAGLIENASMLVSEKHVHDAGQAVFLALNNMEGKVEYFPLLDQFAEKTFSFSDKWSDLLRQVSQSDEKTLFNLAHEFLIYESIKEKDMSVPVNDINLDALAGTANSRIITEEVLKNIIFELLLITTQTASGNVQNETDDSALMNIVKSLLPGYDSLPNLSREKIIEIIKHVFIETRNETFFPRTLTEAENITARFMSPVPVKTQADAKEQFIPEIDQWIDDIEKKIAIIKNVFAAAERSDNERVMPALREVETAVRFFQDIHSYEVFVQIPVVLRENISFGELYVMKRKGNRAKIKPDDFSLFLSLTTRNLGVVDTFINVRSRNVLIRIMVDDEKYFDILTAQHKSLYEALKNKGYNLYEIKQVLRDDAVNILNAVKKESQIINDNRKIDYRV